MKHSYWLVCIIILFFGFFIRHWGIWHGSFAFTYDVGRDLLAVRDLVVNHKFSLIGPTSGQMGIFYGPWWYWFLTIPFIIFNGNPANIAGFISLYSLLGVFVAFWWGYKIKKPVFGIFLGGMVGLMPFYVNTSTQIWSPDLLPTSILISLYLLYKLRDLTRIQLFLFGVILMLITEMEIVFGLIFFASIIFVILLLYRKRLNIIKLLFLICGFFAVQIPRILFELRHDFLQTKTLINFLIPKANNMIDYGLRLKIYLNTLYEFIPVKNVIFLILTSTLILYFLVKKKNLIGRDNIKYLISLTLIAMFFLVFSLKYQKDFWDYYLIGLPVVFAVAISLSVSIIFSKNKKILICGIFIYLLIQSSPVTFIESLRNPLFKGDAAVYRNQIEIIDYIYKESNNQDFNVTPYTPPLIEYTWRYLFSWYGKKTYGYEPEIKRSERLYMVIEPDPGYEGRIVNWLKIRENDGKTVKEKIFPSGITVQSRIRPKENKPL